jgi:hypothetical protein
LRLAGKAFHHGTAESICGLRTVIITKVWADNEKLLSGVTAFSNAAGLVSSIEEGARYKLLKSMIWEATWHSHITRVIIITISRTVQLLLRSDHGMSPTQWPRALNNTS